VLLKLEISYNRVIIIIIIIIIILKDFGFSLRGFFFLEKIIFLPS
jgi:hypothetical protein